ncbi:MAG TPA: hypothetical protein VHL53_15105 [Acidimicrobiia bacterium]|nr:hypothetical protein [Acidimicrobiia bacterium]
MKGRPAVRLLVLVAVAVLMAAISAGNRNPHHPLVHLCCGYSPAGLAAGRWWTVAGSALLIVVLHPFGVNSVLLVAVVVPSVLRAGLGRTAVAFFAGHVTATLAVAAVVLPLAAGGWHPAEIVRVRYDVGASAGVAAVAGALAVSLADRRWGAAVIGAFTADFLVRLGLSHTLAEIEHLIALAVGVAVGRHFVRRDIGARTVSSTVHGGTGTLNRVDGKRSR